MMNGYLIWVSMAMLLFVGATLPTVWAMDGPWGNGGLAGPPREVIEAYKSRGESTEKEIAKFHVGETGTINKQVRNQPMAPPGCGFPKPGMMPPGDHGDIGITGRMMEPEHPVWMSLMALDLDDKQRESIGEIKSRSAKDIIRKRADIKIAGIDLRDILNKRPMDMNAVRAKLEEMASLSADIHFSEIKAIEEAKAKLTPQQREIFGEKNRMRAR